MKPIFYLLILLMLGTASILNAANEQYPFTKPAQRTAFAELTHELRCLVCQNQDLADSNAPLAVDLRAQIYQMLLQGKSKTAIREYMLDRYGDFILFKPPFKATTYVLWLTPFVALIIAFASLIISVQRRQRLSKDLC